MPIPVHDQHLDADRAAIERVMSADSSLTSEGDTSPEVQAIDPSVFDQFRQAGPRAEAFIVRIISEYVEESSSRMTDLKDASVRADAPALRRVAHGLKGASSTVGAARLAAICGELETRALEGTLDGTGVLAAAAEREFARVCDALGAEQQKAAAGGSDRGR